MTGCQLGYLVTEATGVLRVSCHRVPIDAALRERLPPEDREKLDWVARVREFSVKELGLETGKAYTTYYDTGGRSITSIVVASDPLALVPYRWHFPIVGSVPYKGYFDPARAEAERARLQKAGWDAVRLPVAAFSTLGWMEDPVLSTMLKMSKGELAEVLIHELTHRTVYFPGGSEANESLATAVSREGTLLLLAEDFGGGSPQIEEYLADSAAETWKGEILDRLRADLDALYRSELPRSAKLARKAELFRTASRTLRESGLARRLEPSNALLVLERQYKGMVPFFEEAMSALGGPNRLIARLKELDGTADGLERLAAEVAAARSKRGTSEEKPCTPPGS
jgi:predicted aminopeptidase